MLVFPPEFTSKKLPPGYVWNMKTKTLFSFKYGELREMKVHRWWKVCDGKPCYQLSVYGCKRYISVSKLMEIEHDWKIREVQHAEG